jgi:hypothetical protein
MDYADHARREARRGNPIRNVPIAQLGLRVRADRVTLYSDEAAPPGQMAPPLTRIGEYDATMAEPTVNPELKSLVPAPLRAVPEEQHRSRQALGEAPAP